MILAGACRLNEQPWLCQGEPDVAGHVCVGEALAPQALLGSWAEERSSDEDGLVRRWPKCGGQVVHVLGLDAALGVNPHGADDAALATNAERGGDRLG